MQRGPLLGQGLTAEVYAWGDAQVLKLFHEGFAPRWIELEARVTRSVHKAGLAAPAVGEVLELDGRRGIIFERVDGISMLQAFLAKPWRLLHLVRDFVELQVAMHNCVAGDLPPQRVSIRDALARATQLGDDVKEKLLPALENLPAGEAVCHGDYHPDNVIMAARGPVAIDWMTATRGNPVADMARTSLLIRADMLPPGAGRLEGWLIRVGQILFHAAYLREYRKRRPVSAPEMEAWIPVLAAARLPESVPDSEKERLLGLVHKWACTR